MLSEETVKKLVREVGSSDSLTRPVTTMETQLKMVKWGSTRVGRSNGGSSSLHSRPPLDSGQQAGESCQGRENPRLAQHNTRRPTSQTARQTGTEMAATVTESGGMKVITEVIPQTDPRAAQLDSTAPQPSSAQVKGFRKAQPKALGAIQIVSGFTQISFGIALMVTEFPAPALTVASGVYFWIGFLLVSSGSVLVETERRESIWLVKVCYIISGLVILATLAAMIIHSVEMGQDIPWCSILEGNKMTLLNCSQSVYVGTSSTPPAPAAIHSFFEGV
ncbi:unnamed protein product [Caretta caretta]